MGAIWICRASLTSNYCLLAWPSIDISSTLIGWWSFYSLSATTDLSVNPLKSFFFSVPSVWSPFPVCSPPCKPGHRYTWDTIHHTGLFRVSLQVDSQSMCGRITSERDILGDELQVNQDEGLAVPGCLTAVMWRQLGSRQPQRHLQSYTIKDTYEVKRSMKFDDPATTVNKIVYLME